MDNIIKNITNYIANYKIEEAIAKIDELKLTKELNKKYLFIKANYYSSQINPGQTYDDKRTQISDLIYKLLSFVEDINSEVKKFNCPIRVPDNYIPHHSTIKELDELCSTYDKSIVIIWGPSGSGKSTLLADCLLTCRFGILARHWIDCNLNNEIIFDDSDIIVIDNIHYFHPFVNKSSFIENVSKSVQKLVVFTTSDTVFVDFIRSIMKPNSIHWHLIELTGFNDNQAKLYLENTLSFHYSKNDIVRLEERLPRLPIIYQIISELLISESRNNAIQKSLVKSLNRSEIISDIVTNYDPDEFANILIDKWLGKYTKASSDLSVKVLFNLANIPVVGMSLDSLLFVMLSTRSIVIKDEIIQIVNNLVSKGYVSYSSPNSTEGILQVHDFIRSSINKMSISASKEYYESRERYIKFIEDGHCNEDNIDLATKTDILISKLGQQFDFWWSSGVTCRIPEEFKAHEALIRKYLPSNSIPSYKSAWLGNLFKPLLRDDTKCSHLIGLGQILFRLSPNTILGDLAWLGRLNYDGWARGTSINAATHHWINLTKDERDGRAKDLEFWFKLERWNSQKVYNVGEGDIDITACFIGLCRLNHVDTAFRLVSSLIFKNRIKVSLYSVLGLYLFVYNKHPDRIKELLRFTKQSVMATNTANIVLNFICERLNLDFEAISQHVINKYYKATDGREFSMSLSLMTKCEEFKNYLGSQGIEEVYV